MTEFINIAGIPYGMIISALWNESRPIEDEPARSFNAKLGLMLFSVGKTIFDHLLQKYDPSQHRPLYLSQINNRPIGVYFIPNDNNPNLFDKIEISQYNRIHAPSTGQRAIAYIVAYLHFVHGLEKDCSQKIEVS